MLLTLKEAGAQLGTNYRQTLKLVHRELLYAINLNPNGSRPDWAVPQSAVDKVLSGDGNSAAPPPPATTNHKPVRSMFG